MPWFPAVSWQHHALVPVGLWQPHTVVLVVSSLILFSAAVSVAHLLSAVFPPTTTNQQARQGLGQCLCAPCALREGSARSPMHRYSVNTERGDG